MRRHLRLSCQSRWYLRGTVLLEQVNRLRAAVFGDLEVFLPETRDRFIVAFGHNHVDDYGL